MPSLLHGKQQITMSKTADIYKDGKRRCGRCREWKDLSNFIFDKIHCKHRPYCRECRAWYAAENSRKNPNKVKVDQREQSKRWRQNNPRRCKSLQLRSMYGIDIDQYEKMISDQNGMCAICKSEEKLNVDHCHTMGHVRGLLCSFCNKGLGMFRDDPERLRAAAIYLRS